MRRALVLLALLLAVLLPTHAARAVAGFGPILVPPHSSAPANPGDLADMVMWLRADQVVSPVNGSKFSSWVDLANGGATYTQSTSANQFTWNASDSLFNNKPSVTGTGVEFIPTSISAVTAPYTIYFVEALVPSVPFLQIGLLDGADDIEVAKTGTAYGAWYLSPAAGNLATTVAPDTSPHVTVYVCNSANSAIYIDSSTVNASSAGLTVNNISSTVYFGRNVGAYSISGNVPEVVMYEGAHTSAQVHTAMTYFAARYGQTWN